MDLLGLSINLDEIDLFHVVLNVYSSRDFRSLCVAFDYRGLR